MEYHGQSSRAKHEKCHHAPAPPRLSLSLSATSEQATRYSAHSGGHVDLILRRENNDDDDDDDDNNSDSRPCVVSFLPRRDAYAPRGLILRHLPSANQVPVYSSSRSDEADWDHQERWVPKDPVIVGPPGNDFGAWELLRPGAEVAIHTFLSQEYHEKMVNGDRYDCSGRVGRFGAGSGGRWRRCNEAPGHRFSAWNFQLMGQWSCARLTSIYASISRGSLQLQHLQRNGEWEEVEDESAGGCLGYVDFPNKQVHVSDHEGFVNLKVGESWTTIYTVADYDYAFPEDLALGDSFRFRFTGCTLDWWDWGGAEDHVDTVVSLPSFGTYVWEPCDNGDSLYI
ncbi:hypothetical protein BJX62DRAFT_235963 [Aspergillus germanicus]